MRLCFHLSCMYVSKIIKRIDAKMCRAYDNKPRTNRINFALIWRTFQEKKKRVTVTW